MGPEEYAEFSRELEICAKEAEAGELIDAEDVLAKLRATVCVGAQLHQLAPQGLDLLR